jgi:cobyrinic acid a,c-diamide synthase
MFLNSLKDRAITSCPALLISAPASGQGKTTLTAAMARYHARQGRKVRVFKTGPDFIDPMFLEKASGHPVYQLDLWMVGEEACRQLLFDAALEADLILIEGMMGLFDGRPSSADLAQAFGVPVLAVIDAGATAETFGAVAHGLATYRTGIPLAGVVANCVAGPGHAEMLKSSLPASIAFCGAVFHNPEVGIPDRHLGLVQAQEIIDLERRLEALAAAIGGTELAALPHAVPFTQGRSLEVPRLFEGVRIAIASDTAFSFVYPANLKLLRVMGAELIFFSPLYDAELPEADSVYLPGGYPELHLEALADNEGIKHSLRQHVASGKPLLAECGGMLYLLEELRDCDGQTGSMCGILPGRAQMQNRLAGLGLQSVRFCAGELRAHTFHHSSLETPMTPIAYSKRQNGNTGEAIYRSDRVTASYLHWYLPSCPATAVELLHP